ncbi:MAG: DUF167 domain-containing protein [Acidimicrobiia bacterium]|nr:DUF167 domain-containing protein [Acidimicrobiia bacterium]
MHDRHDLHRVVEAADDAVVIAVHAQPGAGRSEVLGRHGDALKVKVAVPPTQGRANEVIGALLADILGVPAKAVELTSGAKGREKRFTVADLDLDTAIDALERAMDTADRRPGT